MEVLCFIRAAAIPLAVFTGAAPLSRIPLLYVLGLTTLIMNQMRQLADHHFDGDGEASDVESHILDSCNFTRNDPLTLLFFPFSIRYHALHHLFPSLPYHNLAGAHTPTSSNTCQRTLRTGDLIGRVGGWSQKELSLVEKGRRLPPRNTYGSWYCWPAKCWEKHAF